MNLVFHKYQCLEKRNIGCPPIQLHSSLHQQQMFVEGQTDSGKELLFYLQHSSLLVKPQLELAPYYRGTMSATVATCTMARRRTWNQLNVAIFKLCCQVYISNNFHD